MQWSDVPSYLKTKTSLNKMGIFRLCQVTQTVEIYGKTYKLYDIRKCLAIEKKYGNKNLIVNASTKNNYLIAEMNITGDSILDEVTELAIIDFDGRILFLKFFKQDSNSWTESWEEIYEIIKDKIVLFPNTICGKRMIDQMCEKYGIEKENDIYAICSKHHIQHKLSVLKMLEETSEKKDQDILQQCFEFLNILCPKAKIYRLRIKAQIYFNKLCEYRIKMGDKNGKNIGNTWLIKEYGSNNFSNFSYETCEEIIELIYPLLRGLGILPKRID